MTPPLITIDSTTGQRDDDAHPEVAVSFIRADLAGWPEPRPIETAPRDGMTILAYIPYEDGGNWWTIYWDCGWRSDGGPSGRATHWLPLPPPPGEWSKT